MAASSENQRPQGVGPTPLGVGVIGCGNISEIYLKNLARFSVLRAVAVADLDPVRAEARARQFGMTARSVDDLLASDDIDLVINLTIPAAHAEISQRALAAGKHVHTEKPLAINRADGVRILALAAERGLRVGGAPDTFLGAGGQTCRALIDNGAIGVPVAATAFMVGHGPEPWHPDPEFFYKPGGGPLLDMGPYYITAMVNLLGPVLRVSGGARASFAERVVGSGAKKGQRIAVETPTHITGTLEFESGAIATLVTSFDVWHHRLPNLEIYGSEGSLAVPDPNSFGGPVLLRGRADKDWRSMPLTHGYSENARGLGAADMAAGIRSNRPHRASGALAGHVLDVMLSLLDSAASGQRVGITTPVARPAALPPGLKDGEID
ncbi:MAG: Gfo/Idh/MocA family oxidoreductase [Anaerolineales bacterium]|nr:Gfo/Idh/MocA family oxidoreductase [Anaerolineales bacterium]